LTHRGREAHLQVSFEVKYLGEFEAIFETAYGMIQRTMLTVDRKKLGDESLGTVPLMGIC
jgi:hypothetical protein